MPMPLSSVSAERVADLAERLDVDVSGDEAERFAAELNDELPGYAILDELSERGEHHDHPARDVRFDPGANEDPLNAFITKFEAEGASDGPLAGLDLALKDNMAVAGVPLTAGSRVFEGVVPQRNSTVADRLLDSGARLVGKTNMDELAYGPTSETSQFGPVANPHDEKHVAGGSSSGSAAAVADGQIDAALGSDTGGSIRIPASFCGIVGFKPTWGMVPRDGFVDLAYTLDHIGPMASDVETAAQVFDSIAGASSLDPSSALAERIPVGECADAVADAPDVSDLSLAAPEELLEAHVDDEVREHVGQVLDALDEAGATIEQVSVPTIPDVVYAWNAITNTEFAAAFLRHGVPIERPGPFDATLRDAFANAMRASGQGFGETVRTKAVLGAYLLDRYNGRHYVRARNVCARLHQEFKHALDGHDALVAPTMPVTAPQHGEWNPHSYGPTEEQGGLDVPLAYNTRPVNLAGLPAASVPAGTVDGLPVGLQFIGGRYEDADVLAVARSFERFHE